MANNLLLAYSYDESDVLRSVPEELRVLKQTLADHDRRCAPLLLPRVTPSALTERLKGLQHHLLIFHFAGHAHRAGLQVNISEYEDKMTYIDLQHFGDIMEKHCKNLKLVFLNGCSTGAQAELLRAKRIPAVIAARAPLNDWFAFKFSTRFYELFFFHDCTLEQAFNNTISEFRGTTYLNPFDSSGRIKSNFLENGVRGLDEETDEVYADGFFYILNADAETRREKFSEWLQADYEPPKRQLDLESNAVPPVLIDEEAYLLCDRKEETQTMENHITRKAQPPQPLFLLISADYRHLPYDLVRRYEKFTARKDHHPPVRIERIDFPDPGDFDLPADPDKPKSVLKGQYQDRGLLTDEKHSRSTKSNFPADYLLWVVHKLPARVWKQGMKSFFEYYIGHFCHDIQQQLTQRYAIICYLSYTDQHADVAHRYIELFESLEKQYNRVRHLGTFKKISEFDIEQWYLQVFKDDLSPEEYPGLESNMYLAEAKKIMIEIIQHEQAKARKKAQRVMG